MHDEMQLDSPLEMDVPGFGMQRSKQCSLTFCTYDQYSENDTQSTRRILTSINCLALRTADCWRTSFMRAVLGSDDDEKSMIAIVLLLVLL